MRCGLRREVEEARWCHRKRGSEVRITIKKSPSLRWAAGGAPPKGVSRQKLNLCFRELAAKRASQAEQPGAKQQQRAGFGDGAVSDEFLRQAARALRASDRSVEDQSVVGAIRCSPGQSQIRRIDRCTIDRSEIWIFLRVGGEQSPDRPLRLCSREGSGEHAFEN